MATKTRTGTVSSGITSTAAKLSTLFGTTLAAAYNDYEDVTIVNTSADATLEVASMEGSVPAAAADFKSIPPGSDLPIKRLSSKDFWIKAASGTPSFDFIGTPN